jgi:hypothetical protein
MVEYICEKCNKIFNKKNTYMKHMIRKKPCQKNEKTTTNNNIQCNYCYKIFSRIDVLNRHISNGYCKVKRKNDEQMEKLLNEMAEMKKRLETLESENKHYKEENKKYKQVIKNNTIIEQQNNIFNVIAFGKEDISFITDATFKKILNKGFNSIPALVDELHFNKNKPEHHNIYISNIRDDYVLVFDGNDWNLQSRKDVLDSLYYSSSDTLEMKFKELVDSLDKFTIRKFERFLDKKDDDIIINDIKKDLKILLYNRRNIVKETKKITI